MTPTAYRDCLDRARGLLGRTERALLGIAGAPGSGKTALAVRLVEDLNAEQPGVAAHVPMDGFHLADVTLAAHGSLGGKGAVETFDGWGYAALLERLAARPGHPVFAPGFDREVEQPIAGSIEILPEARLLVSEGNYLLVDDGPWRAARALFDEVWFCEADERLRTTRLVERHVAFGKTPAAARSWVSEVDGPNAAFITPTGAAADWTVRTY